MFGFLKYKYRSDQLGARAQLNIPNLSAWVLFSVNIDVTLNVNWWGNSSEWGCSIWDQGLWGKLMTIYTFPTGDWWLNYVINWLNSQLIFERTSNQDIQSYPKAFKFSLMLIFCCISDYLIAMDAILSTASVIVIVLGSRSLRTVKILI